MDTIDIDGDRYIRASLAARDLGYTADYVGQLSRAGKISARQVGRVWYVKDGELSKHKRGNVRSNKEKTRAAVQSAQEDLKHHQIHNVLYDPHAYMPEYRKRLMDAPVKYESDQSPVSISLSHRNVPDRTASALTPNRSGSHSHHSAPVAFEGEVFRPVIKDDEGVEEDEDESEDEDTEINLHPVSESKRESVLVMHEPPREGVLAIEDLEETEAQEAEDEEEANAQKREFIEEEIGELDEGQEAFLRRLGVPNEPGVHEVLEVGEPVTSAGRTKVNFRRTVVVLMPILVIAALCFSISSVFLEGRWIYEQGTGRSETALFETSYGVRAVSAVARSLSSYEW